jgi:putative copper resistance protein D
MNPRELFTHSRLWIAVGVLAALMGFNTQRASAQDHSMHSGQSDHESMSMDMDEHTEMGAPQKSKILADKKESEFNHHLAGVFVILAGIFVLAGGTQFQSKSLLRFAWPACFLLSGVFLLVFSDTELWPFGPQSWWYGLTHNIEDLQHKTFAVILLALGAIEVQRTRGVLKAAWAGWAFPVLAFCGSVLLLFHQHHSGAHGAEHMARMARIQSEHMNFAVTGLGIGVFKGLSELPTRWQVMFARLWSVLMIVLGVLLLRYTE